MDRRALPVPESANLKRRLQSLRSHELQWLGFGSVCEGQLPGREDQTLTPMEEALRRRLGAMSPASRSRLLRLLNLPTAEPAALIEALYPDSEFLSLREFLLELEEDLPTLAAVVAELRRMERNDHLHSLGSGTMGRRHAGSVSPTSADSRMSLVRIPREEAREEKGRAHRLR